jgi:hypothetical protein
MLTHTLEMRISSNCWLNFCRHIASLICQESDAVINAVVGSFFPVIRVRMVDEDNQTTAGDSPATAIVLIDEVGAQLFGSKLVDFVNGTATFDSLSFTSGCGHSYTLRFISSGVSTQLPSIFNFLNWDICTEPGSWYQENHFLTNSFETKFISWQLSDAYMTVNLDCNEDHLERWAFIVTAIVFIVFDFLLMFVVFQNRQSKVSIIVSLFILVISTWTTNISFH